MSHKENQSKKSSSGEPAAQPVVQPARKMVYLYAPDLSTGAVFQSERPEEERHNIEIFKLGRDFGQKGMAEEASAILAAYRNASGAAAPKAPTGTEVPGSGSTEGAGFVFKRDGENWVIRFGDEHGSFRPIDGLSYIARLLATPGRRFSAEDLKKVTVVAEAAGKALTEGSEEILQGQVGVTKVTVQKAADKKTIQGIKNRLTQISVEREAAREAGDIEKLEDLEEEEKKINDYLAAAQNVRGDSRPLADSQRSMFNSVKQAVERAVKKFASAKPPLPQLHEHLSKALDSRNSVFEYRPSHPAPTWEL
jgi:hypothetical protein